MDFNYTLKYRTFDQLMEDVQIDLPSFALENMIEPQQLIKLARKINYDLGLRINQTREVVLEVCHGKVKLPDDFFVWNYGLICVDRTEHIGYDGYVGGTNIQEVPNIPVKYQEYPGGIEYCNNASVPNPPNVFINCKGESYELIQVVHPGLTRKYTTLIPIKMKASQNIEEGCPNLYVDYPDQGWLKDGFLFTTFQDGVVYVNYQGELQDEEGNLMVLDNPYVNEYYEYALKQRLLENLYMNGEDVVQKLNLIEQRLRAARNTALSLVNTPDFLEMYKMWEMNRKAQYGKYYDMFKSYNYNSWR